MFPAEGENSCPLCGSRDTEFYHEDARRSYLQCQICGLVFVPARFHLSPEAEKAEYDRHQNSPDDAGYVRFLSRLTDPLLELLKPGSKGLDFGSGPGPALDLMLAAAGHHVVNYDPYYAAGAGKLRGSYDFITATEVFEHLARPGWEIDRLWQALRPGGVLAVLTQPVLSAEAFKTWRYIHDPTHITFFSEAVFQYLSRRCHATLTRHGRDVFMLHKDSDL